MDRDDTDLGVSGSVGFIATVAVVVVAAGTVLGAIRFAGGTPAEVGLEGVVGAVAFGAVFAAPGVLALLALKRRPILLLPATVILVPLSAVSLAGATLPLLIPALMLGAGYGRRSVAEPTPPGRSALATAIVLALLVGAAGALFVHEDPRSYATPTVSGSTSDVITLAESLVSLALTATAIAAGWVLASPRRAGARRTRRHRLRSPGRLA